MTGITTGKTTCVVLKNRETVNLIGTSTQEVLRSKGANRTFEAQKENGNSFSISAADIEYPLEELNIE